MSGGNGPGTLADKVQSALTGVKAQLPAGTSFQIGGTAMKQSQIVAQLSGYLPPFAAVATAKATYEQSVATRTQLEPEAREFLVNLRAALVAFFKRGNPILGQFGMGTGKPGTQSPETMVVAAAARVLTRQKRGTVGKKQKQLITVVGKPAVTVGGAAGVVAPVVSAVPPAVEAALAAQAAGSETAAQPAAVTAPVASDPVVKSS